MRTPIAVLAARRRRRAGGTVILLSDTFDRGDNPASMGSTDGGTLAPQAWTPLGGPPGTFGIISNTAYCSADGGAGGGNINYVDPGVASCTVGAFVSAIANGWRLAVRCNNLDNHFILDAAAAGLTFYRRQAGSYNQVGLTYNGTISNGDFLSITPAGDDFTIKQNGITRITGTDSFNNTLTKHGIGTGSAGAHRFNNFSITVP